LFSFYFFLFCQIFGIISKIICHHFFKLFFSEAALKPQYKGTLLGFYFFLDYPNDMIIMENGVLVHCKCLSSRWRKAHRMTKLNWPPNSPNLNHRESMENCERPCLEQLSTREHRANGYCISTYMGKILQRYAYYIHFHNAP